MKSTFTYGANYQIIGKCEPQKLSYAGAFKPTEGTLSDLAAHIRAGHPWMPAILDEGAKRWQQHANRAEVLGLDIDGGMTIEEAIAHPFIAAHCGLAIETASSTPDLNKFRLVFRLAEPTQNWQTVRICNQYLLESVNVADKACKDASRFFFGAPGRSPFILDEDATLPSDFVDQALAWHSEQERIQDEAYRAAEANRAKYSSNDPTDAYELARQALSFIPGRSPGSGNYDECVSVLMALTNEFGESDANALAESWSPSIKGVWDIPRKIRGLARGSSRPKTIGSLFHIAKGYGFKFPERAEWQQRDREEKPVAVSPQAPVKLSYEAEVEQVQKKLNTLTYQPTTELNQRFLGELALPAPGTITVVSSPCKTGKTEGLGGFVDESGVKQFDGIIDKHRADYPDAHVLMIGNRTVLLKQSAKRLGITHIQGLRGKGYRAIQNTREIALCLDSLDKIDIDSIPPNSLIILDEGDAILKHGVEGGTLKARQEEILGRLEKIINKVLSDGGWVLIAEDDITDLPIDTLKDLTGNRYPVDLTVNRFQASHWDVSIGDGSKSGVTKRVVDCLSAGERLIVPTSAQIYGEELDLIIQREFEGTKRIVRLDSKTVETLPALVDDPKAWLKDAGVDLLIFTSTAESGFNISIDAFDRMIAYFASAGTREHIQFLERYRLDVNREIFCRKFSNFGDGTGRSLLPANILKDWKLLTRQTAMVNRVEKSLEEDANLNPELSQRLERFKSPSEQQEIWNQVAANFKARTNGASAAMLERLTTALIDRGHDVTPTKWQKDDRFKELHKQARQEIDLYGAIKFGGCDTSGTHIDDARVTLNSGTATQEQRLIAYKRVMQDELPGAPLDNTEFVLKAIIENSGRLKKQTDFLFLCQNSDVASFLDKRAFKSQLDKPFMMLRRFRHNRVKVDLMAGIFDKLMAIAHSDSYRESDEPVQAVKLCAVKNAFEIKRVFGSKVTEEQTAIYIVNELLRKLGFQKEAIKQEGSGRKGQKRSRIWKVIDADCPHRQEILKALRLKWEKEFSKSAHTILNTKEPLNKIVCATAEIPSTPDDLADWRTPYQRELIKEWWAIAKLDPEQARFIKSHIPIEVLEWAIA